MRVVVSSFIAAGAVAGTAAAVLAYQSASSVPAQSPAASAVRKPAAAQVRFLPCESGTRLVHGTCVRVVRHVVVRQQPDRVQAVGAARTTRTGTSLATESESGPSTQQAPGVEADEADHESEDAEVAEVETEDHGD